MPSRSRSFELDDNGVSARPAASSKGAERKHYKKVCTTPHPPSGDKCLDAKANLARLKLCLQLREDFGSKWYNDQDPGHMIEISNTRRAIEKAQEKFEEYCQSSCP